VTEIETSTQAAEALKPVAGAFAFVVFTLGIVGTGLLAVPVLAGSAAYALGEARQWPTGLARKPMEAKAFYATILLATMIGVGMNFSSISPIRALFWSAVVKWDRRRARDGGYDGYHGEPQNHGQISGVRCPQNSGLGRDLHHGSGSRRDGHCRIDWMTGVRFLLDETSWADWHREAE
jgi:hypothetical protein